MIAGVTIMSLIFICEAFFFLSGRVSLFRGTAVLLKDNVALVAAVSKFRRIEQMLRVRVGLDAQGTSTIVLLRVSRFDSVGADPDLQCTGFELARHPAPDHSHVLEWVPVASVAAIAHMQYMCRFGPNPAAADPMHAQQPPCCYFHQTGNRSNTIHNPRINRFIFNPSFRL